MGRTAVLTGALDTKGAEFSYVREAILRAGLDVITVDFGVLGEPAFVPEVGRAEVARALMPVFLRQLRDMGFSGVQNFPTVGLIDGTFRANIEATGMGYDKEVQAIAAAHELDLFTSPYVFDAQQATAMAEAGADMLVAHVGLTTAGSIGAAVALSLDEAVQRVLTIAADRLTALGLADLPAGRRSATRPGG